MEEQERERAVHLVQQLMSGSFDSDQEMYHAHDELSRLLPDPDFSALIYWPATHPMSAGLTDEQLTPQKIVQLAFEYRPFAI